MRLLLDTHILIWWHENNPRLNKKARVIIQETEDVFVSMVSLWEIAIRLSSGRLKLGVPAKLQASLDNFKQLDLAIEHVQKVMELPWHHRDPFDRMLVAQAQSENLHLMTNDNMIMYYDTKRIEV